MFTSSITKTEKKMKNLTNKQKETKARKAEKLMKQALELVEEIRKSEGWHTIQNVEAHLSNAVGQIENGTCSWDK